MITKRRGLNTPPPIVVGNWKMHKTAAESVLTARRLARLLRSVRGVKVVIAPSFTALEPVGRVLKGSRVGLGAQNVHWEEEGGFTGEVSPRQIWSAGVRTVLVGHSERRRFSGETDDLVNRKVIGALRHRLVPILCVGETLNERRSDRTAEVIRGQLAKGLMGVSREDGRRLIIGYEPVWAIGGGHVATAMQIAEAHDEIDKGLVEIFGPALAGEIPILYGGSVTSRNIAELASVKRLNGVLVGGASLDTAEFAAIARGLAKGKQEG